MELVLSVLDKETMARGVENVALARMCHLTRSQFLSWDELRPENCLTRQGYFRRIRN